jgi:hypothetical protein
MAQLINWRSLGFEAQTKKLSRWFWGSNHQTRAVSFEAQTRKPPPPWFWGSTKKSTTGFENKSGETVTTSFEVKLEKTVATSFEAKLEKTIAAGFEAKPLETIATGFKAKPVKTVVAGFEVKPLETADLGFKAQPKNLHSSSPRAQCRPHMAPPDLSIPGHRVPDLSDHPRSSALDLLLLPWSSSLHVMPHLPPAHHETSKHDSPNETKVKEKQNKTVPDLNSNLTKLMTHHNQIKELTTWFLINTLNAAWQVG